MSNFAKHWANLRVGPIMSKMMAKVDRTGCAFCDFARHDATMAVVKSGLSYNLHGRITFVEFDGDPTMVSSFLHFSRESDHWRDLAVIIVMVCDFDIGLPLLC